MMALNANSFWGGSDMDASYRHTPPAPCVPSYPSNWDIAYDLRDDNLDPKSSLELLQGPAPCYYEPRDEWLVEFGRLQDIHDRVPAPSAPCIPPPHHSGGQYTFPAAGSGGANADDGASLCPPPHGTGPSPAAAPKAEEPSWVQGGTDYATPTPTPTPTPAPARYPHWSDDGSGGGGGGGGRNPGSPGPMIYPSALYGWASTPAYAGRPASTPRSLETAMRGLREMEHNLQAETKRRIIQVEQSRPD
ncbi:hypothetical protein SAMD00023353_0102260 [Rosellinia necatrix]|uniref:Uncharacterized protein n=1 Tax=Rosellinia necatrix TaxID=77044 RepID=A0A1S7UHP3_ROSNE|nr:hypothetical protein SAMD00023353_0102260 [Rosellinia necatrix]